MKLLAGFIVFGATITALWFHTTSTPEAPVQKEESANVFLNSRQEASSVTTSPTPSTTPSATPSAAPSATPSSTPTLTRTPTPTPTATIPTPTTTHTPPPKADPPPEETPTSTPPSTLSILSLTNPVAQKQDATIEIQSMSNAQCSIEVTLPSGTISTSKDLAPKTANSSGKVSWSWGINWNTKPGTATIKLSCTADGQTYSGQTEMRIIASQ